MDEHPGGRHLIAKMIGKDATTAFFGGVYDHSNAAHNVRLLVVTSRPRLTYLAPRTVVVHDACWCPPRWHAARSRRQGCPSLTTSPGGTLYRTRVPVCLVDRSVGLRGHDGLNVDVLLFRALPFQTL